ncbi:MAG: hypothetical protein ACOH19_08490 [Rhodoglobus sp.]
MTNRIVSLAVVTVASALMLTACSLSVTPTVSASTVAETAEDALEAEVGTRPDIDCGTEAVKLVDGTKVDCILTDPGSGTEIDALVTLSKVDGSNFTVNVKVADAPSDSASEPEPTGSSAPAPDAPVVTGDAFAKVVVSALTEQLDYTPTVECFLDVAVIEGATTNCTLTDDKGEVHDVLATIETFDGSTYTITAKLLN